MSKITAGSFSRLNVFESCPFRAKLAYVDKIKENERPPLKDGKEYPNDRGTRIHDYAEYFVRGEEGYEELIPELLNFKEELYRLREIFPTGRIFMEDMWLFDDTWTPLEGVEFWDKRIWMRIKLDVCIFSEDGKKAYVVDYKTGKRYGNEVKHAEQTQLYALAVAIRFPEVEEIVTELWYTDQDELAKMEFRRSQALRFLKNWNNKMERMTTAVEFPTKANMFSCRYCPFKTGLIGKFGPDGTGHCDKNPV